MEYLAELFFDHFDFSRTPLLTNDFSLNHRNLYQICMQVNSVLFSAYRDNLELNLNSF